MTNKEEMEKKAKEYRDLVARNFTLYDPGNCYLAGANAQLESELIKELVGAIETHVSELKSQMTYFGGTIDDTVLREALAKYKAEVGE